MITDIYNLPVPLFNSVNKEYKPNPGRFSVTDLIGPPLIRHLKIKHWDEPLEDASERLWMLLGSAVDYVISKHAPKTTWVQKKFEIPIDGIIIVGKPDLYYVETGVLEDWKVTSVWSFLLGNKVDWERQLNCYCWGLRKQGVRPGTAYIHAILRDWQKSKALREPDYPNIPFVSRNIPLWTFEEQEEYIKQQLEYHRMSEPRECTSEEKWEKPTTYAVMKKGRISALRVLDSEIDADKWCIENGHGILNEVRNELVLKNGISIVERPGECTRCLNYCPVRKVCPYMNGEKNENNKKT